MEQLKACHIWNNLISEHYGISLCLDLPDRIFSDDFDRRPDDPINPERRKKRLKVTKFLRSLANDIEQENLIKE